jgi:Chemotaxis protein CheC, inhibitor of MCP methylation
LLGGFVNGWADRSGEATHLTPPAFVEGRGRDLLPADPWTWSEDGTVFSIASQLRTVGEVIDFDVYLFPQRDSFERLVDEGGSTAASPVPLERLTVLDSMTEHGARQASDKITTMTGIETEVSVSQLRFVPIEDAASRVPDKELMSVVLEFEGPPSGYVVIGFDRDSAREIANAMVPVDGEFGSVHRSAIQEIGNLMTSGFVDGWANYLERKTEISPPELVTDHGPAVITSVAARLGHAQEYVFVYDSTISTPNESFHCELYALPNEAELREALESISAEDAAAISDAQLQMTKSYDDLQ